MEHQILILIESNQSQDFSIQFSPTDFLFISHFIRYNTKSGMFSEDNREEYIINKESTVRKHDGPANIYSHKGKTTIVFISPPFQMRKNQDDIN